MTITYYVIEGQDSTGKSTQAELLAQYLGEKGKEVEIIEEPGGNLEVARIIRELLKNKDYDLDPYTNVLLFTAARRELWTKRIKPLLSRGGDVISTRNWWSTLAYQGFGQGIDLDLIRSIVEQTMPEEYVHPEKSVILVLPEEERIRRQKGRNYASSKDTYESQPESFQMRVNNGYLKISEMFRSPTYDASPSIEKIQEDLRKLFGIL
ncbi:dTMP kinase [Candidatus Saccharibacteria bacterium]|nr:dTMP kinase [Candidatus Saccharibacteria bacterium]